MTDREKIIEGLEEFVQMYKDAFDDSGEGIVEEALNFVKALKPRVLTLEEAKQVEVVWLEMRSKFAILEPALVMIGTNLKDSSDTLVLITVYGTYTFSSEYYGNQFRCWNARPTDAQMEAVAWKS